MIDRHRVLPLRIIAIVAVATIIQTLPAFSQVFELRRVFERYESGRVLIGANLFGPISSEADTASARINIPFDVPAEVDGYLAVDYWQLRGGVKINMFSAIQPFLFWNPVIGDNFGGENSRWSASIGWEGIFAPDDDYDPRKTLQPDNSVYSPTNSFSILVGYWFGQESGKSLRVDTNWFGRGFVDTMNYRTAPLDTNSYVRGRLLPAEVPGGGRSVRYSSRNGFSAGFGLGTGRYAGSGPISKHLNLLYPGDDSQEIMNDTGLLSGGLNPMAVVRYRYNEFIGQLEIAGEDLNLGLIYRGVENFDFELGTEYLEHLFDRPSRGPNRTGIFLGARYSPFGPSSFENGDQSYDPATDSDGDGLPDGDERRIGTDPNVADSDGDGLPDGLEIYSYKSNPRVSDSDGDGLSDGQEINAQRRTDPLRRDTDEDGISDGEEVSRGSDPLTPGEGSRSR